MIFPGIGGYVILFFLIEMLCILLIDLSTKNTQLELMKCLKPELPGTLDPHLKVDMPCILTCIFFTSN